MQSYGERNCCCRKGEEDKEHSDDENVVDNVEDDEEKNDSDEDNKEELTNYVGNFFSRCCLWRQITIICLILKMYKVMKGMRKKHREKGSVEKT